MRTHASAADPSTSRTDGAKAPEAALRYGGGNGGYWAGGYSGGPSWGGGGGGRIWQMGRHLLGGCSSCSCAGDGHVHACSSSEIHACAAGTAGSAEHAKLAVEPEQLEAGMWHGNRRLMGEAR